MIDKVFKMPSSSGAGSLKYDSRDIRWDSRVAVPPLDLEKPKTPIRYLTDQGLEATDFRTTDAGNAKLFAKLNAETVRFDHRRNHWFIWQKHYWARDRVGTVLQLAKEAAEFRYLWAVTIDDTRRRALVSKWAIQSESRHRLDSALYLARTEPEIADLGDSWNTDPWLLGTPNGVVNLRTGRMRPGRPEDRITAQARSPFDPDAQCARWLQFLEEVFGSDQALIDYIQRAIGYSLSGHVSEQCLFLCYGEGANGKTTFLNVLRRILGDYAADTPFATLELNSRSMIPNDLAALVGKRVVTASETSETTRLNEARVKALTGGDPVTARFLHSEYFTFQPEAKFWLSSNHKPCVRDQSTGFWRRIRLVPFLKSFEGEDIDKQLDEKLQAENAGILAWAVRGCRAWQEKGLESPAAVASATEEYRTESDPLAGFLEDRCVVSTGCSAQAGELFRAYQEWADAQGLRDPERLAQRDFGTRLGARFTKKRKEAGNWYLGIGLKEM